MPPTSSAKRREQPELYRRLLYDPKLEAQGFQRLAAGDVSGARQCLSSLVRDMDVANSGGSELQVVQLLLDTLQRVNERVHRPRSDPRGYQTQRLSLIEAFSDCRRLTDARELYLATLKRLLEGMDPSESTMHPLIRRAKLHIQQNYRHRIYLSTVASHLHVSPNYLSRLFRQVTGFTLTSYVQRLRVNHARALLAEGNQSISEIAYAVGYQNYRDFYRNFVKYENAPPREVRRRLLEHRAQTRTPAGERDAVEAGLPSDTSQIPR